MLRPLQRQHNGDSRLRRDGVAVETDVLIEIEFRLDAESSLDGEHSDWHRIVVQRLRPFRSVPLMPNGKTSSEINDCEGDGTLQCVHHSLNLDQVARRGR